MSTRHDALVIAGTLAMWVTAVLVTLGICVGVVVLADWVFSAAMRWVGA